jgi:multisubunit Na+/H+ antiporter MnhF subunit
VCGWIYLPKSICKYANFHMDLAWYWLDTVDIVLARLNYVTSFIFLRYFDHLNFNQCVWIDSFMKIHMEISKFPHGFCMILLIYCRYILACLNYVSLVIFLRYLDHFNFNPCVWIDWFTKIHMEIAKFPHRSCIVLIRHCRYSISLPKLCYFSYFPKIFWPSKF